MKRLISLFLLTVCTAGCATIHRSTRYNGARIENGDEPLETVEIENTGWMLFKCLPIASGDPARPNSGACRWFTDTVTLENNIKLFDLERQRLHTKRFINLASRNTEETFLFVLLTRNSYHTSAVLLKDDAPAAASKASK